jgi:hypothetical protein
MPQRALAGARVSAVGTRTPVEAAVPAAANISGIVDENERRSRLLGELHHVNDLRAVDLACRASQYGEILAG